jgi:protein SCO1/2
MQRLFRIAAVTGIALLAMLWVAVWVIRADPSAFAGTPLQSVVAILVGKQADGDPGIRVAGGVSIGGPFTLVGSNGQTVTDTDFRGRWMLVYFGYTYCPDVCPTELQTMAAALGKLGPDAKQIVPIFITVDPERDTPSAIGEYVKLFDDRMVGLTGTSAQIADVAKAYRVYFVKVVSKNASAYLMDHSSLVYLMDPQGHFVALYNPQTDADAMATGLRDRISQKG